MSRVGAAPIPSPQASSTAQDPLLALWAEASLKCQLRPCTATRSLLISFRAREWNCLNPSSPWCKELFTSRACPVEVLSAVARSCSPGCPHWALSRAYCSSLPAPAPCFRAKPSWFVSWTFPLVLMLPFTVTSVISSPEQCRANQPPHVPPLPGRAQCPQRQPACTIKRLLKTCQELRATDIQSCILRLLYAGVAPLMSVQLTQAENMA